jgi:hypothetical protein
MGDLWLGGQCQRLSILLINCVHHAAWQGLGVANQGAVVAKGSMVGLIAGSIPMDTWPGTALA